MEKIEELVEFIKKYKFSLHSEEALKQQMAQV